MTAAQCRAARGLLDWSPTDLAAQAGIEERLIRDFEAAHRDPPSGTLEALRSAFIKAGVDFGNGASSGVRLGGEGGSEGTRLDDLTTENDR